MYRISEESFQFMADLYESNNKEWFAENRKRYEKNVRQPIKAMAEALVDPQAGDEHRAGGGEPAGVVAEARHQQDGGYDAGGQIAFQILACITP